MSSLTIRIFLTLFGLVNYLAYHATGHVTLDNIAMSAILSSFLFAVAFLPFALFRLVFRRKGSGLDRVLFRWPSGDPFYLRHILTSLCVFGIIGSGKSSGVALFFARILLRMNSCGLILASNPDDYEWWSRRFKEAGRSGDLIHFSPTSDRRWNLTASLKGADALELTHFFVTVAECLVEEKKPEDVYWKELSERMLENCIRALLMTGEEVCAPNISRFLATAAPTIADVSTPNFANGYCGKLIAKIGEGYDANFIKRYWRMEFPAIHDKPRSTALSAVNNLTHRMSVGIGRDIFSTTTNASNADLEKGKWILLDFPVSRHGPTAKVIYSAAKLIVQKQVLKNNWNPSQPVTCIWSDECWHVLNRFDRDFLAEARKHGGVLMYLCQSVTNYHIALGKNHAESLLGMFGTRIACAADVETGDYFCKLCGEEDREEIGGSFTPSMKLQERLEGQSQFTSSFNVRRMPIMTGRQFTSGMAMGGSKKVVQGWVFRPEIFNKIGTNIQLVDFHQE